MTREELAHAWQGSVDREVPAQRIPERSSWADRGVPLANAGLVNCHRSSKICHAHGCSKVRFAENFHGQFCRYSGQPGCR
jgi:hypothetical protein